jgi:hypothetical protein
MLQGKTRGLTDLPNHGSKVVLKKVLTDIADHGPVLSGQQLNPLLGTGQSRGDLFAPFLRMG